MKLWKTIFTKKRLIALFILTMVVVVVSHLRDQGFIDPERMLSFLSTYPRQAPLIFIVLYTLLSVALVPTLPLNMGAGFLWGAALGTFLSIIGATFGAITSFLIARYLVGDFFRKRFRHPAWLWLHQEIKNNPWQSVAFTRINPIFSFGPLNYFYGITSVPFITYTWATVVFLIPPSALFASLGSSLSDFTLSGITADLWKSILIVSAIFTGLIFLKLWFKRTHGRKQPPDEVDFRSSKDQP